MADERPTIVPPAVPPAAAAESSPVTSSPVSITGGRPKLGPRRQSRFTEEPMTTQTPASSISVPSFDVGPHGWEQHPAVRNYSNLSVVHNNINNSPSINHVDSFESAPRAPSDPPAANAEDVKTAIRGLLRTLNSILHSVPCLLLLYIMGMSLKALKKDWVDRRNVQALIFLAVTMLDCLLDVLVLFLIKRPWANWELCARFFFGILYLAQFFVYIGFGSNVFKEGYTYWNMSESGGVAFAFVLMWWLSVWNLLHPVVCRWTAIKLVLSKNASSGPLTANAVDADAAGNRINQIRRPSCFSEQRPTSFNPRLSTVGTEGTVSMVSLTWRRWISRTRSSHFSRDFDVEAGVGTSYQNSRSRRGTVDEGVQMQHQQQQHDQMPSALVSAEDITLKGDDIGSGHHHIHDDLDDDDDDYEKRAGSSLVQKRSTSRLGGGNGEDEDDDDYDEDYEKGRAGAGTGGGGGGGVIKKDEESGSRGVESGKRPKDVGQ